MKTTNNQESHVKAHLRLECFEPWSASYGWVMLNELAEQHGLQVSDLEIQIKVAVEGHTTRENVERLRDKMRDSYSGTMNRIEIDGTPLE